MSNDKDKDILHYYHKAKIQLRNAESKGDTEAVKSHLADLKVYEERAREILTRQILASLPESSFQILMEAFSVQHGGGGVHMWTEWLGRALALPLKPNDLDLLRTRVLVKHDFWTSNKKGA